MCGRAFFACMKFPHLFFLFPPRHRAPVCTCAFCVVVGPSRLQSQISHSAPKVAAASPPPPPAAPSTPHPPPTLMAGPLCESEWVHVETDEWGRGARARWNATQTHTLVNNPAGSAAVFPYRHTKEEKSDDGGRLSRTPGQDDGESLFFLCRSSDICGAVVSAGLQLSVRGP